jgi:hypothetical protein
MARLFDVNNFSQTREIFHSTGKGKAVIQKTQDTSAIFDANTRELNGNIDGNWKGDMHKVASVPLIVVDMWREELKAKGAHDTDPLSTNNRSFLIAKINSSEWSKLRTKQGRV